MNIAREPKIITKPPGGFTKGCCPECSVHDYIQFVFVHHNWHGTFFTTNPGDTHFLFMCANGHVWSFNPDEESVEVYNSQLDA